MIQHIAKRLTDLHEAGYAHRDLKPSNVMWLPRENRWTLIDFGCAARIGEAAPMGFSPVYAAPEVIQAVRAGHKEIHVTRALDAWSLGILSMELLCGFSLLDTTGGLERVRPSPTPEPVAARTTCIHSATSCSPEKFPYLWDGGIKPVPAVIDVPIRCAR